MNELKGFDIDGYAIIAEDKKEAIEMYITKVGRNPREIVETNLDNCFSYFKLEDIDEEDYKHIYDRKYPDDGIVWVSLKRPFARKYGMVLGDKKEIFTLYC